MHLLAGRNCLLFEADTLLGTFLHPLLLPGSEVQLWDPAAAHKGVRISVGPEGISWHFRDAGVVTYYLWQGDFDQWRALLGSENPSVLPPKPAGDITNGTTDFFPLASSCSRSLQHYFPLEPTYFFSKANFPATQSIHHHTRRHWTFLLPVPIMCVPELRANETSHERPNPSSIHKGLCKCPNPNVTVPWCPIQLHELLCQTVILQYSTKWLHITGLGEHTEFSPGDTACKLLHIRAKRGQQHLPSLERFFLFPKVWMQVGSHLCLNLLSRLFYIAVNAVSFCCSRASFYR